MHRQEQKTDMYYIISFLYKDSEHYCIWVSDEKDYVLFDENKLVKFKSKQLLFEYASENNIVFEDETETKYDVDKMQLWCNDAEDNYVDCDEVLNFWNISTDFAAGNELCFAGNENSCDGIYEKIFFGNNILEDSDKKYYPEFMDDEVKMIKQIIREGINNITDKL